MSKGRGCIWIGTVLVGWTILGWLGYLLGAILFGQTLAPVVSSVVAVAYLLLAIREAHRQQHPRLKTTFIVFLALELLLLPVRLLLSGWGQ